MTHLCNEDVRARRLARLRIGTALVAVATALATGAALPSSSLAYEGPFCTNVSRGPAGDCASSYVNSIRRAIAKAPGGWTEVEIETEHGYKFTKCTSNGCTANTGYLAKSERGYGALSNCGSGTHTYSGYLYP
jgi:hypothetical protein